MMNIKQFIEQDIEMWSKLGHPAIMQRFILRNGREFSPRKYEDGLMEQKQCFMNATKISGIDTPYIEGYALGENLPLLIHHAWVAEDDFALDPTLRDPEKFQYWGVEIGQDELFSELARNEVYGVLDTGFGINIDFMLAIDPGMEKFMPKQ